MGVTQGHSPKPPTSGRLMLTVICFNYYYLLSHLCWLSGERTRASPQSRAQGAHLPSVPMSGLRWPSRSCVPMCQEGRASFSSSTHAAARADRWREPVEDDEGISPLPLKIPGESV